MPYIHPQIRRELEATGVRVNTPGELNYKITKLVNSYIMHKGLNYGTINDVLGALEGAKLEAYRRVAARYEDNKIYLNGDVYDESIVDTKPRHTQSRDVEDWLVENDDV